MGVGVMRDQTLKRRDLNASHTLGCVGKTYSKHGSGHAGGKRPCQTEKKPKARASTHMQQAMIFARTGKGRKKKEEKKEKSRMAGHWDALH
jgi:hypothetical protein